MNKVLLLSCIALTLVLVANGAPLPPPTTLLQYLLPDLKEVQNKLKDVAKRMEKYELYIPSNASSIADLQCFTKELKPVAEALKYESKGATDIQNVINNINVTINSLTGSETTQCHYVTKINMEGFFEELITFCQRLIQVAQ